MRWGLTMVLVNRHKTMVLVTRHRTMVLVTHHLVYTIPQMMSGTLLCYGHLCLRHLAAPWDLAYIPGTCARVILAAPWDLAMLHAF